MRDNDIRKLRAERVVTQNILNKLQATLPLVSERAQALRNMAEANLGPRQQHLKAPVSGTVQELAIHTEGGVGGAASGGSGGATVPV